MLVKKYHKARLSPYTKIFFQLGLALSLLLIYVALEWKTFERTVEEFGNLNIQSEEILDIPITERVQEVKPPPPPPPAPEQIEVVTNEEEIEETVLESTETDETEYVEVTVDEIEEIVEEEEVIADVPFAIIEDAPIYPGCTGTKAQKKLCLQEKIKKHVNDNYRTEISQELGLEEGKKKVFVQFKIDTNGKITDVRARGPHKRLEKEAIRVVEKLPEMIPGKQRGIPVGVKYTLPITLMVRN